MEFRTKFDRKKLLELYKFGYETIDKLEENQIEVWGLKIEHHCDPHITFLVPDNYLMDAIAVFDDRVNNCVTAGQFCNLFEPCFTTYDEQGFAEIEVCMDTPDGTFYIHTETNRIPPLPCKRWGFDVCLLDNYLFDYHLRRDTGIPRGEVIYVPDRCKDCTIDKSDDYLYDSLNTWEV